MYLPLLAPGKTDYTACHPRKTTTYISHVVSITTHTHDRRKSIGKKKQRTNKKRKEKKWVHGAKKKKKKRNFGGLLASLPPERDVTWFFDGLQQHYERLPMHPPKHGLPANYAIDSWPWLSRVSVLGAPVPCLLFARVWVKHAVCSMVSRQQHTRTSARTTYHSYRKCNIFFFINMNIKRLLYIGQSDACTTKLANSTRTAL